MLKHFFDIMDIVPHSLYKEDALRSLLFTAISTLISNRDSLLMFTFPVNLFSSQAILNGSESCLFIIFLYLLVLLLQEKDSSKNSDANSLVR